MRKTFLEPELEVVRFGTEDIITTSFVNDGGCLLYTSPSPRDRSVSWARRCV